MTSETDIKKQVREFYDQVGWQLVGDDTYQNAHYEDLRLVARQYIHNCHLRVLRHLPTSGKYLLDAGSGPIQYPEYLEYSRKHQYRVCADISIKALQEARTRIGNHGLFVVCDVAYLPFKSDVFSGEVSLHTIHHLPEDEHLQAYQELYRVLQPGSSAAIVNGWPAPRLMRRADPLIKFGNRVRNVINRLSGRKPENLKTNKKDRQAPDNDENAKGTFTNRHDAAWILSVVGGHMPVEIFVWRSVSVRFMRSLIHPALGGRFWLGLIYALEERWPRWFGENGQYPIIELSKPAQQ